MPSVSVIMPVFNQERFLAQAIESVLRQTFTDFELLIINDGCTDGSMGIAASYRDPRIRLVDHGGNRGLAAALNSGVDLSPAEFVARQDADDLSHPERLERQVAYLVQHPDVVLLGTRLQWIGEDGRRLHLSVPAYSCAQIRWSYLLAFGGISGAAAMFRREPVLSTIGRYSTAFRYSNDAEFHSRIIRRFRAENLPAPLYLVRAHADQMTHTYGTVPRAEAERITVRNMLDLLQAGGAIGAVTPDVERELTVLRALHTRDPELLRQFPTAQSRGLLLELLHSFRRVYGLSGSEARAFDAWLSQQWLVAANVHLIDRPAFALWLWGQAIRLRPARAAHHLSVRLAVKCAVLPLYRRLAHAAAQRAA